MPIVTPSPDGIVVKLTLSKMIQYDSHDHGAGFTIDGEEKTDIWETDMDYAGTFLYVTDQADFKARLAEHLRQFTFDLHQFYIFGAPDGTVGRLDFDQDEDADGWPLSDEQSRQQHKQLFLCDYSVYLYLLPDGRHLTADELTALLPGLEEM